MEVLFLVGHEHLNHLVLRVDEAVQAASGDGSTPLVERQRGAENLDSFAQPRVEMPSVAERHLMVAVGFHPSASAERWHRNDSSRSDD